MYELVLFAGDGGGNIKSELNGNTCVGAVEIEKAAREVLLTRQVERFLPRFPIWDDIKTFRNDNPNCRRFFNFLKSINHELVISGGFPCQDISVAGAGKGLKGERSGLWFEMERIIREIQPTKVEIENSSTLTIRGLNRIIEGLAQMGYVGSYGVLGGADIGNISDGKRLWLVAFKANRPVLESLDFSQFKKPCSKESCRRQFTRAVSKMLSQDDYTRIKRDSDAVARGMDRLKAIGNGQNSFLAAIADRLLSGIGGE